MKKIRFILGVSVSLIFVTTLSGCIGYYPCDNRSNLSENYIEDYALEYEMNNYSNYHSFFMDIETVGQFLTGERVRVTPDQNHRVLIEHNDYLLKFLFITDCTQDEIYYYEVYFPYYEQMKTITEEYGIEESLEITIIDEDNLRGENYGFLDPLKDGFYSPLAYRIGRYTEDGIDKDLYLVVTGEYEYALVSKYSTYNEIHSANERNVDILFEFSLDDIVSLESLPYTNDN